MLLRIPQLAITVFTLCVLVVIAGVLFPPGVEAQLFGSPFRPDVDKRFAEVEGRATTLESQATSLESRATASEVVQTKKFVYNFAVHGGAISTIPLGVTLPAKALITRSFLRIDTQLADDGSGTLAFQCEDANNIKTATDMTGSSAGAMIEGQSTGAASAFVQSIAADCTISAVIGGAAITAGKVTGYVTYTTHD